MPAVASRSSAGATAIFGTMVNVTSVRVRSRGSRRPSHDQNSASAEKGVMRPSKCRNICLVSRREAVGRMRRVCRMVFDGGRSKVTRRRARRAAAFIVITASRPLRRSDAVSVPDASTSTTTPSGAPPPARNGRSSIIRAIHQAKKLVTIATIFYAGARSANEREVMHRVSLTRPQQAVSPHGKCWGHCRNVVRAAIGLQSTVAAPPSG